MLWNLIKRSIFNDSFLNGLNERSSHRPFNPDVNWFPGNDGNTDDLNLAANRMRNLTTQQRQLEFLGRHTSRD